jgi:hypothetical protein
MIEILTNIPHHIAAFRASGEVTGNDYQNVVVPHTEDRLRQTGEINFLLLVDTDLDKFTFGAWLQDALLGLKHLTKWRRAAIVTDHEGAISFTDAFSIVAPGEFKGFRKSDFAAAVKWLTENARANKSEKL